MQEESRTSQAGLESENHRLREEVASLTGAGSRDAQNIASLQYRISLQQHTIDTLRQNLQSQQLTAQTLRQRVDDQAATITLLGMHWSQTPSQALPIASGVANPASPSSSVTTVSDDEMRAVKLLSGRMYRSEEMAKK